MDKVNVYIDGDNLYRRSQAAGVTQSIDIGALVDKLVGSERKLGRIYYYTAPLGASADETKRKAQQRYYGYLNGVPYLETRLGKLKEKTLKCDDCGATHRTWVQKGVDLYLGVDMVTHGFRNLYDVAILITTDSDFVEAVQTVKNFGKHVELAAFQNGLSTELKTAADHHIKLTRGYFTADLLHVNKSLKAVRSSKSSA